MKTRRLRNSLLTGAVGLGVLSLSPAPAFACGGLFCSQTQPVNQAAERIIFANNGDGTVTAVIQIMYEGPSENFSWLLPITSVPDADGEIAVASDLAFQRLQQATNPLYNLNTITEGTCRAQPGQESGTVAVQGAASPNSADQAPRDPGSDGVTVAASGVVGAFDWTALAFDPTLEDPSTAALTWLTANGYDVLPQSGDLIRPYLESEMYLLALKLTKGSNTGSIRPIVLTYEGDLPSIPIKLTAVAANDDMGVMTWMLSDARAVPFNYSALELNEARINWFNASSNYEAVVTAAADDIGGQGFVTEFAGASEGLRNVVWQDGEESQWQQIKAQRYSSFGDVFLTTFYNYGSFDGFWDTVRANVSVGGTATLDDVERCPECYANAITLAPTAYLDALEAGVIEPMRRVQRLIDDRPYVTRLYSTLSAADMTIDPVFTYNADLPELSNVHNANRVIECNPRIYSWEAPWRIDLPQGGVIRGTANDFGVWPQAVDSQPANFRVLSLSDSGPGVVAQDNAGAIDEMLDSYNASVPGLMNMLPSFGGPAPSTDNGRSLSSGACSVLGTPRGQRSSARLTGAALLAFLGVGLARRRRC